MNKSKKKKKEVTCDIRAIHGYLNESKTKVLATVSWNDRPEKLEIRSCYDEEDEIFGDEIKLGKGIGLEPDEIDVLTDLLIERRDKGKLGKVSKDGRKAVDFGSVFATASDITDKREAGHTTEDGFIRLQRLPGTKLR